MAQDPKLKELLRELGVAVNDTLIESKKIGDAVQKMRDEGYNAFLVLEATIGFKPRRGAKKQPKPEELEELSRELNLGEIKLKVTSHDLKFLRSLKISVEDLEP